MKMRNKKRILISMILIILITVIFSLINFRSYIACSIGLMNIWDNLIFITSCIKKLSGIILIVFCLVLFFVFYNDYAVHISSFSLLGINFELKNKDKLVQNNVLNYLNTKRSLFFMNYEYDNYYHVIDSYYKTYVFLREQVSILENNNSEIYLVLNSIIADLNIFLTKNHSNYQRWYEYKVIKSDEKSHNMSISDIQKEYYDLKNLISDFRILNDKMCINAIKLGVDINKWKGEYFDGK